MADMRTELEPSGSFCRLVAACAVAAVVCTAVAQPAGAGPNGFDLSNAQVPRSDILRGGPAKDEITMAAALRCPMPCGPML